MSEKNGQPTGEPTQKIRMLGVSVPDASACGGAAALAELKSVLRPKEPLAVTYEPTLANRTDKDGVALAYVMTAGRTIQDVGGRLVQEGFATPVYPEGQQASKRFSEYVDDYKIAVGQKSGIWASCPA